MAKQSQKLVKMDSFFYQNIMLFFSSSVPFFLVFGKKELTQIWQVMIEKKCFLEYFFFTFKNYAFLMGWAKTGWATILLWAMGAGAGPSGI